MSAPLVAWMDEERTLVPFLLLLIFSFVYICTSTAEGQSFPGKYGGTRQNHKHDIVMEEKTVLVMCVHVKFLCGDNSWGV